MTSKCTTSAPAASTASTSAPRRAKSADRIDGAIRCMPTSLAHAAMSADRFVGRLYLLSALFGVLEHRVRQAVGLEFVGMMAAHLAPISLDDLLVRHAAIGLEY